MSKIVMINKDGAVIDIVDEVKPVRKGGNGVTILCDASQAQGYIGSDNETIYAKIGTQFQPSYYDIAGLYMVEDDIPKVVKPLVYKYNPENGFYINEDSYPDTNTALTKKTTDLEDIVLEMSTIIYA